MKTKGLPEVTERFVLHWGEMGVRWGINRTVAQVHALLYLSPDPIHAEAICETLEVARSNVSTSLKELQGWGLVRLVHVRDDKRDHFEALTDVWEMFRRIADERKRTEIDPTRALLRECLSAPRELDPLTRERLAAMGDFFESTTGWYEQASKWPPATLRRLFRLGDKLLKFVGG